MKLVEDVICDPGPESNKWAVLGLELSETGHQVSRKWAQSRIVFRAISGQQVTENGHASSSTWLFRHYPFSESASQQREEASWRPTSTPIYIQRPLSGPLVPLRGLDTEEAYLY